MRLRFLLPFFVGLLMAVGASAQDLTDPMPGESSPMDMPAEPAVSAEGGDIAGPADPLAGSGARTLEEQQAMTELTAEDTSVRSDMDPFEEEGKDYLFIGANFRAIIIPEFIVELFVDEGTGAFTPGFGLQFDYRTDNFTIVVNAWWQDYSAEGYFRAAGDPDTNTEFIDFELSALYASATFLWSTPITEWMAVEYGVGIGLGAVLGSAYRSEAYSDGSGGYNTCARPGQAGSGASGYCDPITTTGSEVGLSRDGSTMTNLDGATGAHYGAENRTWFGGGSWPNLWLWAALPHIALRIKPVAQVQIRIEGGFSTGGFFFGGSLSYGL